MADEQSVQISIPIEASAREVIAEVHNPPSLDLRTQGDANEGGFEQDERALILHNERRTMTWRVDRNSFDMERIRQPSPEEEVATIRSNSLDVLRTMFSFSGQKPFSGESKPETQPSTEAQAATEPHRTFSNRPNLFADTNPPATGHHTGGNTFLLALGCLGVVFGDIGTSPL